MLYIFYGIENFIIHKKIDNLYKESGFSRVDIVKKSFLEINLFEILNLTEQANLFSSSNFVIGDNFDSFLNKKQDTKQEQLERLIEFSKTDNQSTLVLVCDKDKIPKNDFVNELGKYAQLVECKKIGIADKRKIIAKAFENRNVAITPQLIDHLIKRSGMSIRGVIGEVEKLCLLNERINQEIINEIIDPITEKNIFSLVESILNKEYEKTINKYDDLVKSGTSPLTILTLVGNEIALMTTIINAKYWRATNQEIATIFKKPMFVITKASKKMLKYDGNNIIKLNEKISELEFDFKSGKISQNIFIQFFILKMIKGE